MKTNRFNIRASALAGVSAAALIVAASTVWSAPAPQTSYSLDLTGVLATVATQTEYLIDVTVLPDPQIAPTAAVITGSSVTNVFGSGTGFAAQASNNVFTSTAISNKATSVLPSDRIVDLSLIGNDGTNDGIGILQDQMTGVAGAVTPVPITSSVTGGAFTNSLTNFSTGSVDTSNNLLAASTTVNLITPDYAVRGTIPTGYASAVQGSSSAGFATSSLSITNAASVAITSVQTAYNAGAVSGSSAKIVGGTIGDTITATGAISVTAPQTVDNNTVRADFAANSAHNIFLAEIGGNPTFNGSVLVSNNQANIETGGTGLINAASVTDVHISINNLDTDISVAGLADVSNNAVSASATGNAAGAGGVNGGAPTIGNAIAFANGLNVLGTGSTAGNSLGIPSSNVLSSVLGGDLILGNGQGNQGTEIGSVNSGTQIFVQANDLAATGSINVNGNSVSTASTGNVAVDTIQALGGASIQGTVVAANLQTNDATPIHATTTNDHIGAVPVGGGGDNAANGATSVSNNTLSASATGSLSGDPTVRTIALDATNLTSTGGLATIATTSQWEVGPILANTGGGISASNVQANFGVTTPITGTVSLSAIGALFASGLTDASADVNGNSIAASASGNVGYTSVALSGSNGAFSAGVSSTQYNANPVTASATGVVVDIWSTSGTINNSDLVLSNNSIGSSALGNSATNSLSATGFANLTVGGASANTWGFPNQNAWYDPGSPAQFANRVTGALALSNNQTNDGNVTASVADSGTNPLDANGFALFYSATGALTGSTVSLTGNSVSTSAIGAQATNTLTLGGGNLTTVSGAADQIASLGNVQFQGGVDGGVAISSTIDLTGAAGALGILSSGSVATSTLTVDSNSLTAFAAGNFGTNALRVTGTNYGSTAPGTPLEGVQLIGLRVQAEFALQNAQFDNSTYNGTGSRTASITAADVGIALTGNSTVGASPLTVSNNSLDADARNNYASNTLGLTGFSTLSTSAGLQNFQNGVSPVTATIANSKIGIDADSYDVTGSALTVSDNSLRGRAIGNTAFNTLDVGSTTLGGNSGNTGASASMTSLPNVNTPYVVTADYALGSYQGVNGNITSTVSGVFQLDLTDGALSGGSATLSGNSMLAYAEGNNGVNTLAILAGTTSALSGGLMSQQRSDGSTAAATAGYGSDLAFGGIQAGSVSGTPVSVSGNSLTAIAANNDVTNTLTATATSNLVGSGTGAQAIVGTTGPIVAVTADYALFNVQDATNGAVTATANPGGWGVTIGGTTGTSATTIENNTVTAQARVNDAINTLSLSGKNVGASAALGNWQESYNPSTATVSSGAMGFSGGGAISNSPLNVSGNSFIASAGGNTASNGVSVTATNYTTPINAASGGTVVGGGYQATATYAVLNMQQNNGAVNSSVTGLNIGINVGASTPPSVSNSPMSVSGNSVVASAYGNSASNSITMSAGVGTLPSASLTSSQLNTGAVTSTVTGVQIGINVGANTGSSGVSSNNTIGAVAVGNSVANTVGIH